MEVSHVLERQQQMDVVEGTVITTYSKVQNEGADQLTTTENLGGRVGQPVAH